MKIYLQFFKYFKKFKSAFILSNIFMLLFVFFNMLTMVILLPLINLLFIPEELTKVKTNIDFSLFNLKDWGMAKLSIIVQEKGAAEVLPWICILLVICYILKNVFDYCRNYFMTTVEQGTIQLIQEDFYAHIHKLPLSFFSEERKGNLISRIVNDIKVINDSMVAASNSLIREPFTIIGVCFLLFTLDWQLTLFLIILLPILGFTLSRIGDSIKRRSYKTQENISVITSILDETLAAMRIVKAFNMTNYELKRFNKGTTEYYTSVKRLIWKRALASPITEIITMLFVVGIVFFHGSRVLSSTGNTSSIGNDPGTFFTFFAMLMVLMPSIKSFGEVMNRVKEGTAASERVFAILGIEPKIKNKPDAVELKNFAKKIVLENVSFKYETGDQVLQNVNLTINKGEIVAFVGPSGAGKSTAADLIPRFHDVTGGAIKIDGIDIRDLTSESIFEQIGIVTQETILFNDTIRNNISYGTNKYSEEEIIHAAKMANAHNFILESENGYNTIIGDRGVKLSGGQRQRLSIARALLKNPPILILDEATSALDTESEILVQKAIENLMTGRTSIVIAHRLSTIMQADKIIVFNEGKIVEEGKHADLLATNGIYKNLFELQFTRELKNKLE